MKWPLLWPLVTALAVLLTAPSSYFPFVEGTDFTTYHHEQNALERPEFEQSHVGMSSLTFVFDRTGSMFDDLDQVRRGTEGIFNTVMKQRKRFIYNYVLVMFHDPDVDEPLITTEPHRFHQKLRHVNLSGGQDCPEMTLTGIKKALEASLPGSFVYVFTDARSKDFHLIDTVLNLIQEKQSSVVFVMTGDCGDRDHVGYQVFDRIASASFGQVFHLQKSQVTQILEYVRHSVSQRKVHLLYEVRETGRSNTNEIPVDSHMSELALSLAITPTIDDKFLDLIVIDPQNKEHNMQAFVNENTTVNLNTVKLIRIKDPIPGIWKVKTASRNRNTLRVFGHGDVDFKYGFTSVQNQNQRIELTQPRPFANQNAYLWVNMTGLDSPGIVERISMVDYQGKEIFGSKAIVARHNPSLYVVGPFLPPKKNAFFFVRVEGIDDKDYKFVRIAPVATSSMEPSGPKASMLPITPATLNKPVNLTCNIESSTEYQVHWRHGDQKLTTVPLMFPHSDTAVWPISRVIQSSAGRYYCDVTSAIGNHSAHTDLDMFEPPPEIVSLRNATAVLGGPAMMHCQTQTQGSRYTWYRNGFPVPRGHGTYAHNNGSLVIYNTQKVDQGAYMCEVRTRGGVANATIYLSIFETPTARITPKDIFVVENTFFQLSCKVSGTPHPRTSWFHSGAPIDGQRSSVYFIDQNNNLRVYAGTNVKGIFECRADNLAGTASDFSNVNIAEKPVVNIPRDEYLLGVGDNVVLECQVLRGQPTPRIHWERNGQMFTTEGSGTSKYVYQKYGNLHIRGASEVDAGEYSCIAENSAGKDVKTTRVNIGIPPKVISTLPKIEATIFKSTTMQCKALGNPQPTIAWYRNGSPITAGDSRFNVAPDGTLTVNNVQYNDSGIYVCRAVNSYGTQDRSTQLFVVGLEAPVIGNIPPEMQVLEGDDIRLDCILVMGIPAPERIWYKNNKPIHETMRIYADGDGALVIKNFGPDDEASYSCVAKNVVSTAEQKSRIVLISRPRIEAASLKGEIGAKPGENLILPCPAVGTPKPKVAWLLNGHIIDVQSKDYKILPDNSLQITNVGKGHTGTFTCKAVNAAGESTFDTKVSVRTHPTISPSQVSFNHVLGDSVVLPCEVEGEPWPEIKWYLNGAPAPGEVDQTDGSLIMDDITLNHRGEYKCIAKNDVGSDEISMNLTVHTIPIIDGSGFPNTFTVTMNETAVLPCPARASPPPERTWLYERERIQLSPETNHIAEMAPNGSLLLKNVQTEHEGFYTCHVSNLAGEDEIIYSLKVQNPPKIVSRLADTVDVVLGVDLELPCRALGTPKPAVSWQKDGFEVIPNNHVHIDASGSLKIPKVTLNDEGHFTCVAKNPAGEDVRSINVVVQEPPQVSPSQPDDFTYIQGEEAILRCDVRASPNPTFRWFRGDTEVDPSTERHKIRADGSLVISNAAKDDNLIYRCRAENTAGFAEVPMRLNVIVPPEITDSDIVHLESVKINEPFSLYCPVVSHPLPHISWRMNEKPVVEDNTNVIFSEDKRRLRIPQSRVSDAGIYKCIARNPAGESSKTFEVEVLIPPQKNETIYSVKQSALEHQKIEFGCPVSGIPAPTIEWYVNMVPLQPGTTRGGVTVSSNGEKIIIEDALVEHQGSFTCVAANKAGNLPVDIDLTVLAPPQLGDNETLQRVVDQTTTLQCDVKNDGPKSTIKWLFNGKEELPPDVQTSHYSKQLVILQTKPEHSGTFECLVRNTAGESRKRFDLAVWVKPEFTDDKYESSVRLVAGETHELVCPIKGSPSPSIEWKKDNTPVTVGVKDNGQILQIQHYEHGKHRYTCVATNEAGSVFRDFVIETITQPKLAGGLEDGVTVDTQVLQGHSATFECPIASSQGSVDIDWLRNGHLVPSGMNKLTISSEGTRLSLTDIQPDDNAIYTCVAKNAAGEATRNFKLNVLVPPKVEGPSMENVDVIEGEELDLQCLFVAEPTPQILWTKDSLVLPQAVTLLNEQRSLYIEKVAPYDAGAYQCKLSNVAGVAEKIFNVKVISKPVLLNSEETTSKEVILGDVVTLDCPIPADLPSDVELSWTKDKIPILHDQENRGITTLSDGRQLHIPKAQVSDEAIYSCVAKNEAGEATKNFQLKVLVRPNILSEHGDFKVIENNSLVLPCEVEGSPPPVIEWYLNDKPAHQLPNVQILSKGQQFKITAAQAEHTGSYVCTATNKVGKMDINFDVDVIMKPTIAQRVKEVIEVVKGEKAYLDCVVNDPNFNGEITWLKNYDVISGDNVKFTLMKGNRKLIVNSAQLDDEASYSCRVRNDAGTATINYKLEVLVPPEIIMLEKDKNRTVVENGTIGLSCPATGKPEPSITWYKDGTEITPENINKKIKNGQISGNDLRISRIMLVNGGKFTCEAKNKAGSVDQDVNVEVMTPPKIIRDNISSEVEGKLNDHAEIQCFASGRPAPTIRWLKAGRPLEASRDVYLSSNHMRLHFTQLDEKHADKYTCIARNPAGEDKRDFSLTLLESPKIDASNIPREIETNSGRTTTLNCPATGSPSPIIAWYRNGTPLPIDERFTLLNGGRQLQIRDSKPEDSARFMCIAENRVGSAELSLDLKVIAAPEIRGPEIEEVKVLINYPKELRCDVNGSQPISIEWFKSGRSLESDGASNTVYLQPTNMGQRLHILSAQKSDNTRFTCVAKNAAGEGRKHFDLIVQIPPSINDSISSPLIQSVIPNSDFKIDCKVDANPPPKILWFKENQPLAIDDSTILTNDNQTLYIRTAQDRHGGSYTCQTENEVGSTSRKYLINLAAPPVFDQGRETMDVNVGSHVTLACRTSNGTGKINKKWMFNGKAAPDGNFSQTVTIDQNKVIINKIRFSDAGEYSCIAENEAGEARKVFSINVLEKPRFVDKTNASASIIIGQPFAIDCSVQGTPQPKIKWLKDGKVIDDEACSVQRDDCQFVSDNQRLIIEEAGENDEGLYTCVAENMPGRDEKDIVVSLLRPPKMEDERALVEVSQGGAQTLKCPIDDRSVQITWYKDDLPIRPSSNIQILNSGRDLYFMNAEPSDAASYSCRARNEAGEDTAYFDVLVLVKPEISGASFRTMDSISNQTVPIYCRASGIPFPSIEWFFGDKKIEQSANYEIGENGTLLRVKNVQSKDVGRYSCVAKNKVGRAESDVFLEVIEAPMIVETPHEIKIIEGQDKTIKCNVKGKPVPTIAWRKDGEPLEHIGARGSENYIHISRAQLKDSAHYTCIATNRVGEKRHSIHVKVLVPPKIGDGERILKSIEGNNLTLNCPIVSGTGIPAPEIRWSKNGKRIEGALGQQLILQNLTVSDATKYACEAKNEAGTASADYVVDVFVKPRIRIPQSDIKVIEGEKARLECKVDGNPPPYVTWLKGGRPITDMNNFLLSPRGESLMILKASTNDGGQFSCLAKNIAGESEGVFSVTVLTAPYLEQTVDQNPKVIAKADVTLNCPVRGNPTPIVTWKLNGTPITIDGAKYSQPAGTNDLAISAVLAENAGRYTCHAINEVSALDTDYALDVIAPPRFQGTGKKIYEILSGESITMSCPLEASTDLEVTWYRGGNPVYLNDNVQISADGQKLTINKVALEDNGKYECEAKNQAGTADADVFLKVYVAPTIDDSNLIENPLAVLGKAIYLECPVDGIPQPVITWHKNGKPLEAGGRYSLQQNNITFGISNVESDDVGKYSCVAENKGGRAEENFNLQVLAPPELTTKETQKITRREGEEVTLLCPVRQTYSVDPNEERDIAWTKDGRSLGGTSLSISSENGNGNGGGEQSYHISKDGYRLIISDLKLAHAGEYKCLVTNRAGEVQGKFEVETLCNYLGTLFCRELEQRHISEYQQESERRKQLAKEEERRRQAMHQWNFDATQRGTLTATTTRHQGYQQYYNHQHREYPEYSVNVAPREAVYLSAGKTAFQATEYSDNSIIQNFRADLVQFRRDRIVATRSAIISSSSSTTSAATTSTSSSSTTTTTTSATFPPLTPARKTKKLSYLQKLKRRKMHQRKKRPPPIYEQKLLETKPTIDNSRNSPEAHVIQGRPFTFHCPVNGYPLPKISWLKDHKVINVERDPDLRLIDNGQALEILSTEPKHKGLWTCQAENDAGDSEINVRLDVWTPPKASVRAGKDGVTRPLGTSVTLFCDTTGNPTPIVTWTFEDRVLLHSPNGTQISEGNTRLDIPVLKLEDSGNYTCVAKNEVGIDDSSIVVDILVPSKIDREGVQLNQRLPSGQTLTLFCDVKGKPSPKVEWYANKTLIQHGQNPNIKIGENGGYIEISNVTLSDQGIYQCVASNAAGNDTLDYNVDVDQKPSILNSGTFQVLEGKVAKLVCNATGEPTPVILWLRNGLRLETNIRYMIDKNVLKIVDTRSDTDSGIYLCMAQNEAGSVQQAFTLEVLVTPKITSTSPNETIVAVGEPFSLRCGASGHPLPAITWELNNENIETSLTSEHRIEGDTLYVKELPQKGTSTFRCTVHNSAGLDEVEFVVKVIAPPTVNKEGIQTLNVSKSDPTVINCDVQVDLSDSEIEWQKDGVQLSRDGNAKIDGKNLRIESTMLNDEGTYTCIAINPAGNATQTTKLHVGVPPKINEELGRIVVKKGERAELLCEAIGVPQPQITWIFSSSLKNATDITPTEESKTTAVFEDIQPEQAGVYTCRATNWAGTVYKDVDLVVLIPPEITNDKANYTANLRDNIILPCNATGIPEPVVSWLKVPDVDIIGNENKYQILGSSLAIKNISIDDDGFYHCIAKSDAGQTVAKRKVTVVLPITDAKVLWTDCNEKGEPIDGIFKQARGDLPESDKHLDHWENRPVILNGTDDTIVKCLPNRGTRTLDGVIEVAPQFVEEPADLKARLGDEIRLRCSAVGPPMPQVFFEKDGKTLELTKKGTGEAEIRKTINSTDDFGEYNCIAVNSVGESRTMGKISLNEAPINLPTDDAEHQLTIVNCTKNGTSQSEHVVWKLGNELIDHLDDSTHAMNNGSLVLSYFAMEDDLDRINCLVEGEPGDGFAVSYFTTNDQVPVVKIKPVKIYSHPTQDVIIDCYLKRGNPLTTRIRWSKDNVNLAADGDKIRVLPNNSLLISNSIHTDRGNYKCRGWNTRGKSWDGVDLFVEDAPNTVNANIGGTLNDKSLTFGELLLPANFTPEIKSNDISMTIANLAGTQTTVTRSIMAVVSMPLAFLGYDSSNGAKPVKQRPGKFERITNYEFESGEKMKVKQKAKGFTDDSLDLDVEFEGEVPAGGDYENVEFDPMEEELIEDAPGHVTGNGHSAVRFGGNHKVPFKWRDSINFDEGEDNDFIPEGETMKVTSQPEITPEGEVKIATTVGKLGRCPDGFTKIKGRCRDINECVMDPEICITAGGNNNSICVNSEGGYECQSPCATGFKASSTDGTCVDIDECQLNTADCAIGQECINTEGSFECQESCAAGYQVNDSGICQDIDECVLQPCKAPMTCKNLLGTHACICPKGFPIINGTCEGLVVDSDRPIKIMDYSSDAQNCPAGYYFEKGKCEDTDDCAFDAPCAYKCTNIPGSYQCECPNGYVVGENGVCVDVDECQFENACSGSELCFNELGSYSCLAKPCPKKYRLSLDTFQCVPTCTNCNSTPINLHLLPVKHGLPAETPLIRLTAHDHDGRVLRKSSFKIKTPTEFFLRTDPGGSATVLNKHILTSGTRHQIAIHSISVSHDRKIKYKTDFLVFVSVSNYPF